jgi:hypothetical protein
MSDCEQDNELPAVALLHGRICGVDLAQPTVAKARIDRVQMRAHELLLGLGDAPAVRLAGVWVPESRSWVLSCEFARGATWPR